MEAPTICCHISMKKDWSYCPSCGDPIEWPPTPEELAKAEEDKRERLERMERDPIFKEKELAKERFLAAQWKISFDQFCAEHRPIPKLQGVAP